MDKLRITGGSRLEGTVRIGGAKNSTLPAMAASLLTADEVVLTNIPMVADIRTTRRLLGELGVRVEFEGDAVRACADNIPSCEAPYDLVTSMRACQGSMRSISIALLHPHRLQRWCRGARGCLPVLHHERCATVTPCAP